MTLMFERRGADTLANTTMPGAQAPGQIAYLADGRLLVVWRDDSNPAGSDLRGRLFNPDGAPAGDEFAIAAGPELEATPFAFALPGGGFVVTWNASPAGGGDWNVFAQRFDPAGAPVGARIAVNSASPLEQSWPEGTALAGGGFVIAWHDYGADPAAEAANSPIGVRAQLFDSAGLAVGGVIEVNSSEAGAQGNVSITALAGGGWLAVWDDFGPLSGIAAQLYAADGSPVGGEFLVSTETSGTQQNNAVAALSGGGFVVAWTGRSADGSASAVRARIYGADGAPQGGEFIVNEGTIGLQSFPAIVALASGAFVISWRDGAGRDGSGTGVRAQAFDGAGARIGGEFVVNTTTTGNQLVVSAAAHGNEFAVAWTDQSGAGGDSSDSAVRFARFVAAPGTEGDDGLSGSVGADDIHGFGGNDGLSGLGGDDRLYGGDGNDSLDGGEGNDLLDSGTGADTLRGGDGDDRLIVGSGAAGELDLAEGGAGTDRLEADLSAAASAVSLTAAAGAGGGYDGWLGTGSGHALDFTGIELLDLTLGAFGDSVTGTEAADTLRGMGGDDVLAGAGGDDILDGGVGADLMTGGAGDDHYSVNDADDSVVEAPGAGTDTVATSLGLYALANHLETLTGSAADQRLSGNGLTNRIAGGAGNDRLDGGDRGNDILDGGDGDDVLVIDRSGRYVTSAVQLIGGSGADEIRFASGSGIDDWATIDAGAGNDRVIVKGRANMTLGTGQDVIVFEALIGSDYRNLLASPFLVYDFIPGTAAGGADRLDFHALLGRTLEGWDQSSNPFTTGRVQIATASSGTQIKVNLGGFNNVQNFIYLLNTSSSALTEFSLGGFTTAATAPATTITGGIAGEALYGTAGDNLIEGLGGDDRIEGGFGADTLRGGEGNDYLNGQTGHDILSGGAGNDRLVDDSGGGDTLGGDEGDDLIEAVRSPNMVKRTLTLDGGAGNDEIAYTQLADPYGYAGTGFTVNIDAGEGADLVRLGARSGVTTVTLGAGSDTLRLAPETGGSINVTDFQAGAGGDRIDLAAYLAANLVNWNQADNPFATGHVSLVPLSATEAALRVDLNGGGDGYVLLATLKGSDPLAFTAENFLGFDPGGSAVAAGPGFTGTAGDDVAAGTSGADSLAGLAGDDSLSGGLGADLLDGGDGQDRLSGGGGDDLLTGGGGADLIEDLDGGNDQLFGGAGDDRIVLTRAAAGTPGATIVASGGEGADRFDVTSRSSASLTLDGGAGADQFNFFKIEAAARVTLGEGRDTIRLEPEYFGPYSNQVRVEEIVVTDFQTGPGGDILDLADGIAYGIMSGSASQTNPFLFGGLRFVQDGGAALLQYAYTGTEYQTLFRFENRDIADFTSDNLGIPVAHTIDVDQAGAYNFSGDSFGLPALRVVADGATVTIAAGSRLQAAVGAAPDVSAAIVIQASGATIINEEGGAILAAPVFDRDTVPSDRIAILGSDNADRVFNHGRTAGTIRLGGGDDYFFERVTAASNDLSTRLEMGDGDDRVEFDMGGRTRLDSIAANGGAGNDTLTIGGITGQTEAGLNGTTEIETLRLSGLAGASITFGARPTFADTYLSAGLTLTVPGPSSSGVRPYTLAPFGTLHLEGGNFTTGLAAPFASIVGSDAAERVVFSGSSPPSAGTVANAVQSVSLGGGDDFFHWGQNQPRPGSVDGGGGNDRLRVDQIAANASLSAFASFETIEHFFSGSTIPTLLTLTGIGADARLLLLDKSVRNTLLQLDGLQTPNLAVGAGGTKLSILANSTIGSLSDRYLLDPAQTAALAQTVENRGTIVGDVSLGAGQDSLTNFGVIGGNVDLGDGNDVFTGQAGGSVSGTVRGGAGDDLYVIDAGSAVEEGAGEGNDEVRTSLASYTLPAEVELLTGTGSSGQSLRGNGAGNRVTGGSGNDTLLLQDGGVDTALGGAGNDVLYFGEGFNGADHADGGEGRDVVVLQGNYTLTLSPANLANVESLSLQSGANTRWGDTAGNSYDYNITMVDANTPAGTQMIVNGQSLRPGEDFVFNGSAERDGKFLVYGGNGIDTLKGGALGDAFFFEGGRWGTGDTVDGGEGRDAVIISAGNGITHIEFGATSLTSIEAISVNPRYASDPTARPSYELVLHNGNVAPGAALVVNGSALTDAAQTVNFDGSAVRDGVLIMFGGAGDDVLTGGLQADTFTGKGGADTYRYTEVGQSTAAKTDQILDFVSGSDRIDLSAIDADSTTGGDQAFHWIGSNAFTGTGAASAGELRAYQAGGDWFVEGDVDGNGSADLVIQLVTPAAPVLQGDFLL